MVSLDLTPQVVEDWVGTEHTTLIERLEPSSFVAEGHRLPVHLNSSCSTACPEDTGTTERGSIFPVEEPEQVERDTTLHEQKKAVKLEIEERLA